EKKSFILFIGSTECQHCDLYKETLNEVISKYQVKISYIDISKLSAEENAKLKVHVNYNGTPTTVFIENGAETSMYDRIDGNKPMNKVVEKLKKKGYIK
ncbi:MAG: thioredoxin family protein, partial [Bacilli bacterium]|nr:thioredoxin family protein [Bacilli bacterium]